jgi:hypothetical protein
VENLTNAEVLALMGLAERTATSVSALYGLEPDEATSIFLEDVARYPDEYGVLIREQNLTIIRTRFKREAKMNARADKIRKLAEECENRYEPEYVRLFLPFFFDRQDWPNGPADENGSKPGWRTGDAIDTALDIKRAWPSLKSWQESVILSRHHTDVRDANGEVDWQGIADVCGYKNAASAEESYRKATFQLAVEMTDGRRARVADHEGPGSRKALSNTAAVAVLANQNN